MTQDERDQQSGRIERQLAAAKGRLGALKVKGREIADVLTAVADVMRESPSGFRAVVAASREIPSRFRDFSAGELSSVLDVHALNEFAQEVASAEDKVSELDERYRMARGC